MLKEATLTVQTCDLKVDLNCKGCVKEIQKIMHKIDGVYQTNVNRQQGKVTVTGIFDMDTIFKKLKKSGMSAQLWDANSAAVSEHLKLQLGGNDMGNKLKDASGKGLPQGEASSNGGCDARSGGCTNDATMVQPQLTPTREQHLPNIQQQIEQRLQMLNGEKLPPQPMGMPPAINSGGKQSGKKNCRGTKVLVPGNANNGNENDVGMKLNQDAEGNQVKNDAIGQPPHNGALDSLNNHSQAKKEISVDVGSHMMGGNMVPQKGGMMRPTNNMISPTSFPMFYPSSANSSGTEMMQQVARNPMPQQPYMMMEPQHEHDMLMNAHFPHSQNAYYGPGCTRYQGNGHLQQHYPPPMYYPMPLPPQHDNNFSDENPNICSLM